MLAGDDDVLLPGELCDADPLICIEINRIELRLQLDVFRGLNFSRIQNPLARTWDRLAFPPTRWNCVKPPVNEQTEACIAEPSHALIEIGFRCGWCGCRGSLRQRCGRKDQRQNSNTAEDYCSHQVSVLQCQPHVTLPPIGQSCAIRPSSATRIHHDE